MKRNQIVLTATLWMAALNGIAGSVIAQAQEESPSKPKVIDVFSAEVQESVIVLDPHGKVATQNLTQSDFKLSENNVAQEITQFGIDNLAINTAVVLDCSMSMLGQEQTVQAAVKGFIAANRDPRNRFVIICAANTNQQFLLTNLTGNPDELAMGLSHYSVWGGTDIADALEKTALYLRKSRPEDFNQIVILTDGQDPSSHRKIKHTLETISTTSNVAINTISVSRVTSDAAQKYLLALAEGTGGFHLQVNSPKELGKAFDTFREMTAKRYNLFYSPSNEESGGMRRVSIELPRYPDLSPYYRMVYWPRSDKREEVSTEKGVEEGAVAAIIPPLPPGRSPEVVSAPAALNSLCDEKYPPHEIGVRTQFTYRGKPRQLAPTGSTMAFLPDAENSYFDLSSPDVVGTCAVENHSPRPLSLKPGDRFWMNAVATGTAAKGSEILEMTKGDSQVFVIRLDDATLSGDSPEVVERLHDQFGNTEPTLAIRCQLSMRGIPHRLRLPEYLPIISVAFDVDRSETLNYPGNLCGGANGGGSFRSRLEWPGPLENSYESSKGI